MAQTGYDAERAEAFAGRMLDMLNGAALMVMLVRRPPDRAVRRAGELDAATSDSSPTRPGSTSATSASGSAR